MFNVLLEGINPFFIFSQATLCYFVLFPPRKSTKHFGFYNRPDLMKFTTLGTADPVSTPQDQVGRDNSKDALLKAA